MKTITRLLLIVPVFVALLGCEVEPPVTPTNPTFVNSPPVETDTMTVSFDLETTEPLVWVGEITVESKAIQLVTPERMVLNTNEGKYSPYLFDEPATLQPGKTSTFSVTYKVGNTLEEPTSISIY